jgi:hypothetical protein
VTESDYYTTPSGVNHCGGVSRFLSGRWLGF